MVVHLVLNGSRKRLPIPMAKGKLITIHSTTLDITSKPTYFDNTFIDLTDEAGSLPLHISIRRRDDWDCVIFNTQTKQLGWGEEQRVYGLKTIFGPRADSVRIDIEDRGDTYRVFFNDRLVIDFLKRVGGLGPQYLHFGVGVKGAYPAALAQTMTADILDITFSALRPLRPLRKLLRALQDDELESE